MKQFLDYIYKKDDTQLNEEFLIEKLEHLLLEEKINFNDEKKIRRFIRGTVYQNYDYKETFQTIHYDADVDLRGKENYVLFNVGKGAFQIVRKRFMKEVEIYNPFNLSDIRSFDLIIDDIVINPSTLPKIGGALTGGFLFGGLGSLAGVAATSNNNPKHKKEYVFKLYLKDLNTPYIELDCVDRENAILLLETFKRWEEMVLAAEEKV